MSTILQTDFDLMVRSLNDMIAYLTEQRRALDEVHDVDQSSTKAAKHLRVRSTLRKDAEQIARMASQLLDGHSLEATQMIALKSGLARLENEIRLFD